ncbi:cysteine desulfurase NifS [Candidatus Uhrbacteria bacterium CG10_big_fil_rev_8_21_14_0_10_48_16]|uniref:Cysteine desulfurase NifS n=1 Tax=Candidatus Uhrbacteria bacterium CG10_big_fil_rev_8_21_14_0_10_48_16 TaxID=1975038 RepID=A0A2M8LG80_9BACT|nr:MAG: cysteine desulfurase NifS [Candidatus Uhrbacteria bacterium CG10_big_fil_rev_8_21_14_0_10_48_16]
MKREVYLDHAATTPLHPAVREVMLPYLGEKFGNPSSFHSIGKIVKDDVDTARARIAEILHARPDEILFTSGGTESDNLAILGYARKNQQEGKHLITTTIEHHAVLEAMIHLEKKEGFEVTYLEPDREGLISVDQVEKVLREDTILVSIMYANNEIGTIMPIADMGNMIQKWRDEHKRPFLKFHTDACQTPEYLDLDVEKLHVDMLTLNGSKMYGPKGMGLLYLKRGIKLQPLQFGGSQERALRPGTEHVAGIMGMAKSLELAQANREEESVRLAKLRDAFIEGIQSRISKTRLNGHPTKRLPNNVNISIMDIEGEAMILYLDAEGVYASTGSACTSASLDPSHVILALGLPYEVAHGSIRFSLGASTTEEDLAYVLEVLPPLVEKLRSISPVRVDEKYFV